MSSAQLLEIRDTTANPAPLGLLGFGMTTVLLNLHNAGCYELNSMILAMGLAYGGTAQIIAGIMEWKKNNTFGTTAFISYGFFWLSLVALVVLPKLVRHRRHRQHRDGGVSGYLGCLHGGHVRRHLAAEPGAAGRVRFVDDPVLPAGLG